MSLATMNLIVLAYVVGVVALLACFHRAKSGQWKPYDRREVEDPDWDDTH